MAITPNFTHLINIPFAENGLKETVIEQITSAINTVPPNAINMSDGYTALYKKPIDEGGYSIEMEKMNYIFWKAYAAIKEIQTLLISGQFTAEKANSLAAKLPITEGGTGATTAAQARINLGISDVTPYNPKVKFSPAVFTQGQTYTYSAIVGAFARIFGGIWSTGDMFPVVYSQGTTYSYGFFKVDTAGTFSLLYGNSSAQIVNSVDLEMPITIYADGIAATPTGGGGQPAPEPITIDLTGNGAYQETMEIESGYTLLALSLTLSTGEITGIEISFNGNPIISSGQTMSGTFEEYAELNGQAGTLEINIATQDSGVIRTGSIVIS